MQCSYPAHFRGTCLIGFNYYCLWSSLKRSKKGSVDNADPHGFFTAPVHAHTHTHNPPHPAHTHTPPAVRLQIANQGDSIDPQTKARARCAAEEGEKSVFLNKRTLQIYLFFLRLLLLLSWKKNTHSLFILGVADANLAEVTPTRRKPLKAAPNLHTAVTKEEINF